MFVHSDDISNVDDGVGVSANKNQFEINGNHYNITGHATAADYSVCQVVGDKKA